MERHIQIGIQGIVRDPQTGGILLGKRKNVYGDGTWGLPGGHMEFGESFEGALARELREEVGITAREIRVFGVFNTPRLPTQHHIQIGCFVGAYEGTPTICEIDRCGALEFFPLGALPEPIFPSSVPLLQALVSVALETAPS